MTVSTSAQRLGIFGGTFDPVHVAHLELAGRAIEQARLDELIFVPCSKPPHKDQAQATDRQRLEMLQLVAAKLINASVSNYEVKKSSTSYTVETLEFLKETNPNKQLVFCLGGDSLNDFTQWHRWQDILDIAHLAVMRRGLDTNTVSLNQPSLNERIVHSADELIAEHGQILTIDAPVMSVSASLIRERIQAAIKKSINSIKEDRVLSEYLDLEVLNYIVENKVYQ